MSVDTPPDPKAVAQQLADALGITPEAVAALAAQQAPIVASVSTPGAALAAGAAELGEAAPAPATTELEEATETVDGEIIPAADPEEIRAYLHDNIKDLLTFLELLDPRLTEEHLAAVIDNSPAEMNEKLAEALVAFQQASELVPAWLRKALLGVFKSVLAAQGVALGGLDELVGRQVPR